MSADVEHPNVTLTAVGTPTAPEAPPLYPEPVSASAQPAGPLPAADPTLPLATTALPSTADTPRWRLTAAGYAILLLGFALALTIPHFRVRAGIREEALVLLSILTMLAGAATVLASFLLNLLRQP